MSKKVIFISLIFIIVIALGGVSLLVKNYYSGPKYRIVNISGIEGACNLSRTSIFFIPYIEEGENLASPVADGDLLLLDGYYFRYRDSDGLQLNFSYDQTGLLKNNDKIISLIIDGDSNVCEWIKNNESSAFKDLRSIHISGPLSKSNLECLKKISEVKPDPGIYIEYMDSVFIKKLFSIFDPIWMVFGEIFTGIDIEEEVLDELFSNSNNLELLLIDGSNKLDFLYNIPELNSLIIMDHYTEVNKNFTFGKIKNLKSLSIIMSDMEDLSYIGEIPGLRSLNLNMNDSLTDISSLKNFSRLKSLNLGFCYEISDISVINSISSLTWLSFPPNISQETFANIVDKHPSLQVVELIGCYDIIDLSPLQSLDKIKAIALFEISITDYTPLYSLKTLEYILIDEENFEENEKEISDLQEALPNAQIIPGGVCLGSGWLLLLFPIILILRLIRGYLYKSG